MTTFQTGKLITRSIDIKLPGKPKSVDPEENTYLSVPNLKSNHKSVIDGATDPEMPHTADEYHATIIRNRYNGSSQEV